MKIEMNKKYRTRDGKDVRIYAVDGKGDYPVHGAIDFGDNHQPLKWKIDGSFSTRTNSADLIEVKEDWEILIEHFNNNGKPVILVIYGKVHICENMKESEYSSDYCNSLLIRHYGNSYFNLHKKEIRIATLEDCKKFILEK